MALSAHLSKPISKGKAKATDEPYDDLDPTITYRHLHARNFGVRDPLRVIALCDSDAFYAACEMVRLGVDREIPLVVLQWDALIAVNYPARKYGISRLKKYNFKELKEKHPDLMIVHVATYKEGATEPGYWDDIDSKTHKGMACWLHALQVSLDYYRKESMRISALFKECLPECEIEKASIDEAFFDFSKCVRRILLERYPYLANFPPDAPNGIDTPLPPPPQLSWDTNFGDLMSILPDKALDDDQLRSSAPVEELPTTWHDIALSIGAELMSNARQLVYEKLGYSTSAGLARNKFLAKLTASCKKPNGQSVLRNSVIPKYLRPLPFQKIRFLGGKLGDAIAKEFEASTVGDLLSISLEEMQRKFGEDSIWVYEILRGIDRSEVKEKKYTLTKSMEASKNLLKPIENASEGFHWIRVLAAELSHRLNEARELSPNLWPKSIVLRARKGYESGRSKQSSFPFTREVTVDVVAAAGNELWKELVGPNLAMKVTTISLGFSGIAEAESGQRSIESFLKAEHLAKKHHMDDTDDSDKVDKVECLIFDDEPTGEGVNVEANKPSEKQTLGVSAPSFKCIRCGKRIFSPSSAASAVEQAELLAATRLEHDDFHFAQDLAQDPANDLSISGPSKVKPSKSSSGPSKGSSNKKKRRKDLPISGIENFFQRS